MSERKKIRIEIVREIVMTSLWVGLIDSLTAFFWDKMFWVPSTLWWSDLAYVISLGTVLGALVVAAIFGGLFGIGALAGLSLRHKTLAPVVRSIRRMANPLCAGSIFILIKVSTLESSDWIETGVQIWTAGVVIASLFVTRIRKPIAILLGILAAIVFTAAIWDASGQSLTRRFELPVTLWVGLYTLFISLALLPNWIVRDSGKSTVAYVGAGSTVAAVCCLLWASPGSGPVEYGKEIKRPDILFIVVDTLRADRALGDRGMPSVKALADRGISFSNAYTPFPKTQPSMAAINTGLFPWRTGVESMFVPVDRKFDTMAEVFSTNGYQTAAFVHNPWIDFGMGHEQGFHEYYDTHLTESVMPQLHRTLVVYGFDVLFGGKKKGERANMDGVTATDQVVLRLSQDTESPLFTWVHLFDPHWPYRPPENFQGVEKKIVEQGEVINDPRIRKIRRPQMIFKMQETGITQVEIDAAKTLYGLEVNYADTHVARILEAFNMRTEKKGAGIVVLVSDHGESLGEHNYYFHHGDYTYNPCLNVPLVVSWPGKIKEGQKVALPTSTVDIYPTLLAMAGIRPPYRLDGQILPGIAGATGNPNRVLPFESDKPPLFDEEPRKRKFLERVKRRAKGERWRGIIHGGMKMMVQPQKDGAVFQLFNLDKDREELNNLYDPEKIDKSVFIKKIQAAGLSIDIDAGKKESKYEMALDPEEKERLEALGYIQ